MSLPTLKEKRKFVRDLIGSIKKDIIAILPKVPKEWDGFELRRLIADNFERNAAFKLEGKRGRDYKNECLVRNLI